MIVYVPTNHMYVGDIFMLGAEDIIHTTLTVGEGLGESNQRPLPTRHRAPNITRSKSPKKYFLFLHTSN